MGCADHRLSSVCHTHRSWGYVLHGIQLKIEVLTVMCALFLKNILHFSWLVQEKALQPLCSGHEGSWHLCALICFL